MTKSPIQEKKNKIALPVIIGPTSVGKTDLLLSLFKERGEVVSCDSVQIYKGLDILSAKPTIEERKILPHHLVDVLDIHSHYSSGEFCTDAEMAIKDIFLRGKIPVLSGGTPYYLKQFLYGKASTPPSNKECRSMVKKEIEEKGNLYLWNKLRDLDKEASDKINVNDTYRLSRAIEIIYTSGKNLSSFKVNNTLRDDYDITLILLKRDKEDYKERVIDRVNKMFSSGVEDEIKALIKNGATLEMECINTIGYKEYFTYILTGEGSKETLKENIVKSTLKYIKKQNTFFSLFKEAFVFNADDEDGIKRLLLEKNIIC